MPFSSWFSTFHPYYLTEKSLQEPTAERAILLENNATQIADIKEHFREQQRLLSGMELLHKQVHNNFGEQKDSLWAPKIHAVDFSK